MSNVINVNFKAKREPKKEVKPVAKSIQETMATMTNKKVKDTGFIIGDIASYFSLSAYEWIVNQDKTPYLQFIMCPGVVFSAPTEDGRGVLNVSMSAINDFKTDVNGWSFYTRIGGKSEYCCIPYEAMVVIYAKEDPQNIYLKLR